MTNFYPNFQTQDIETEIGTFPVTIGGSGPPVLCLHGYPQTHVIFYKIAPLLEHKVTLILTDLRGYGAAPKPPTDDRHSPYSKRAMAGDMVQIMDHLGYDQFAIVGHDRGGRVAHRLATDHPERVSHLSVLDIAPTLAMYEKTDMAFATAYYHWFYLIQPSPLPETMISADVAFYLRQKMGLWSRKENWLSEAAFNHYKAAFEAPGTIASSCEDYRAAATIDLDHDRQDRQHKKLPMPVQALWGQDGFVGSFYDVVAEWQKVAMDVTGHSVPGGHFLPEEAPDETAAALLAFWGLA
ncbi:MAG: alpha/beta fold hydrolase [Candidatus Puniceispirillaceae bacterium]